MTLSSMTGFARRSGASGLYAFEWEVKSVNAKGLDFRMRLPPGWDGIEAASRKFVADRITRGTVYANLAVKRTAATASIRLNEPVLDAVLRVATDLSARMSAPPPTVDSILAIKGV